MDHDSIVRKVQKYMKQLKDLDTAERALEKLEALPITVQVLSETKVGKYVNKLQSNSDLGALATRIVKEWKSLAKEAGYEESRREKHSPSPQPSGSSGSKRDDKERNKVVHKVETSNVFEAMLSAGDNARAPKKRIHKFDALNPADLDTNYRPLPQLKLKSSLEHKPTSSAIPVVDDESNFDPALFKYRSSERARVFAGRKKAVIRDHVDSLFDLCIKVLSTNIDLIEDTGSIPFDVLKTVLEKCSAKQLAYIEERNPLLEEDGDGLWEIHFKKTHSGYTSHEHETWKEAYFRVEKEKENRLAVLSKRISTSKEETSMAGRKAILSDAAAPRNVRRRQIGNNTIHISKPLPHALEVTKARKAIFETGNKSSLQALPAAVRNLNSTLGASKGKRAPVKKGALMAKTMKMLNMKRR